MKVKIKKFSNSAVIPVYKTEGAACLDLTIHGILRKSRHVVTVGFGVGVEIPTGFKLCIAPRSSFADKYWVMANSPGQIDSDYRGEIRATFQYIGEPPGNVTPFFPYSEGDRIIQCWLEPVIKIEFIEVATLSETERGEGSFGSTGN